MPRYNEDAKEGSRQVTERFMVVYRHLHLNRDVKNFTDFAALVGTHPNIIYGLDKGERFVSIDMIWNLCKRYPVNLTYLFKGEGTVLDHTEIQNQVKEMKEKIVDLDQRLEIVEEFIDRFEHK